MEFFKYHLHAVLDSYNHHHQFCELANVQGCVLYLLPPILSNGIFKEALEKGCGSNLRIQKSVLC